MDPPHLDTPLYQERLSVWRCSKWLLGKFVLSEAWTDPMAEDGDITLLAYSEAGRLRLHMEETAWSGQWYTEHTSDTRVMAGQELDACPITAPAAPSAVIVYCKAIR